jgi:hypothetical protein
MCEVPLRMGFNIGIPSAPMSSGLPIPGTLGLVWADPVAGLGDGVDQIIAKEGVDGLKGKACCDDCGCH